MYYPTINQKKILFQKKKNNLNLLFNTANTYMEYRLPFPYQSKKNVFHCSARFSVQCVNVKSSEMKQQMTVNLSLSITQFTLLFKYTFTVCLPASNGIEKCNK